jgi:hypothetical protein
MLHHLRAPVVIAALLVSTAIGAAAQVEIDKTLSRVYGAAVMASDVRQAKLLRLVPEATSDDAVLTALENRLLMLRETANNERLEPSKEAIQAAKDAWRRAWPQGTDPAALMGRAGMTEQTLDGWFRDDLRVAAYLDQRFGTVADRDSRISSWISDLRRRANLAAKS